MKKHIFSLLCATMIASSVQAGLKDGILAFNYAQYPTALAEFTYLQEEGDPVAAYYLGRMYEEGLGVQVNLAHAQSLYRMANDGFYFPASARLGHLLMQNGDYRGSLELLKRAALTGSPEAAFELASYYADDKNPDVNYNQAFGYYMMSALSGNMKAQYQLGAMYFDGRGVPQDYQNALRWLSRSANQGYLLAQADLADMFANNKRLRNEAKAYGWYSIIAAYNTGDIGLKAADKRDILQKKLKTEVLSKEQEVIRSWKPIPAEKSVPLEETKNAKLPQIDGFNDPKTLQDIMISEGFIPRDGTKFGVTDKMIDQALANQNVEELVAQIEKAQGEGRVGAYGFLGDLYKTRLNNLTEAFLWYQKGADAGDIYAQYQLAKMYCEGEGLSQPDAAACYAWLLKVQGVDNPIFNGLAQNSISIVKASATPEELKRGESLLSTQGKKESQKATSSKSEVSFL